MYNYFFSSSKSNTPKNESKTQWSESPLDSNLASSPPQVMETEIQASFLIEELYTARSPLKEDDLKITPKVHQEYDRLGALTNPSFILGCCSLLGAMTLVLNRLHASNRMSFKSLYTLSTSLIVSGTYLITKGLFNSKPDAIEPVLKKTQPQTLVESPRDPSPKPTHEPEKEGRGEPGFVFINNELKL